MPSLPSAHSTSYIPRPMPLLIRMLGKEAGPGCRLRFPPALRLSAQSSLCRTTVKLALLTHAHLHQDLGRAHPDARSGAASGAGSHLVATPAPALRFRA